MPVSVTMPRLGESVTEGTVTRWLKQEGDHVEADEPLLEVSTDKVDTEIPSPAAGVLSRILAIEEPREQCLAALGISWRKRIDAGYVLDIPAIDFGSAQLLLLPGESYVEYQLYAQQQRPDSFVMTIGYGDCGTGYVPIERAWAEHDANIDEWGWVAPGSEAVMQQAIAAALAR